jgi:release factor glutamine methyltransferase
MRIADLRTRHRDEALQRGINPRDVDLLLADLTGKPITWVLAHGDEDADGAALEAMLARRFAGEPLQYIRGKTEFYGREFVVDDRVLIPRPETEGLAEAAIERVPQHSTVIDVGTGSGCIALTLALERPDLRVIGVDASIGALTVAATNARRLNAPVSLVANDVLAAFCTARQRRAVPRDSARRSRAVHIVSNPPYIAAEIVETLASEVRDHEPRMALTPGPRGTEVIEQILDQAHPAPVLLEISYGQDAEIADVASAHRYQVDEILLDLAAIPRVVVLSAAW